MDDGRSSLARMLHPLDAGPREVLVVIKHTDATARYLRVFLVRPVNSNLGAESVDITESVAEVLSLDLFDANMSRSDPHGFVLGHSGSLRLPTHHNHPTEESPGDHIESTLIADLNRLITGIGEAWHRKVSPLRVRIV